MVFQLFLLSFLVGFGFGQYVPPADYCTTNTSLCTPDNLPYCCGENLTIKPEPETLGFPEQYVLFRSLKNKILFFHNTVRNEVAGANFKLSIGDVLNPADKMKEMVYDDELEFTISHWFRRCLNGSQLCKSTPTYEKPGLNMAFLKEPIDDEVIMDVLETWKDESNVIDKTKLPIFIENCPYSHFSQMIWSNATHIGCSIFTCDYYGIRTSILGCSYSEGNVPGEPIYVDVVKTVTCADNDIEFPNLCNTPDKYEVIDQTPIQIPACFRDNLLSGGDPLIFFSSFNSLLLLFIGNVLQ